MTYYGPRCSRYYLHQLEAVRRSTIPHRIVSVIGGMGWLHAIGYHTQDIHLLDTDPDAIVFCKSVLGAIAHSESLAQFKDSLKAITPSEHTVMEGHGLEHGKFYWHFGEFNLASDDHYRVMRELLCAVSPTLHHASLADWNYGYNEKIFVLVSNADGPLGVNGSAILPRVLATATAQVTYVSWLHSITIDPNPHKRHYDQHLDL